MSCQKKSRKFEIICHNSMVIRFIFCSGSELSVIMTSAPLHRRQARSLSISLDLSVNKAGNGHNRATQGGEARSFTYFTASKFCLLAPLSSESKSESSSLPLDEALSSSVSGGSCASSFPSPKWRECRLKGLCWAWIISMTSLVVSQWPRRMAISRG